MVHYKSAHAKHGFVAILHRTAILETFFTKNGLKVLSFNSGGHESRSTAKAINLALSEIGLDNQFKANIKNGHLLITSPGTGNVYELGSSALEVLLK